MRVLNREIISKNNKYENKENDENREENCIDQSIVILVTNARIRAHLNSRNKEIVIENNKARMEIFGKLEVIISVEYPLSVPFCVLLPFYKEDFLHRLNRWQALHVIRRYRTCS